jgi:hypothetical protein
MTSTAFSCKNMIYIVCGGSNWNLRSDRRVPVTSAAVLLYSIERIVGSIRRTHHMPQVSVPSSDSTDTANHPVSCTVRLDGEQPILFKDYYGVAVIERKPDVYVLFQNSNKAIRNSNKAGNESLGNC